MRHYHRIDLKDPRFKSVSGGFLDPGIMDTPDDFARLPSGMSPVSPIVVGHAVTVIIAVCVGFLVFLVVLGVIRIRAAHRRTSEYRDDEQEMTWDENALTITVNPLDQIEEGPETHYEEDDDSDASGCSYHEDSSSEEDELPEGDENVKCKDMYWDDYAHNF